MKKITLLVITMVSLHIAFAQKLNMPVEFTNDKGAKQAYQIQKGDQLVYHVNTGSQEYDFIVTINDGGIKKALDFNYTMTNSSHTSGHVNISADARAKAKKYTNYFSGGILNLTDASTVWLTDANYSDLDYGKTQMSFDGGAEETMYTQGNNQVSPVVKIKGVNRTLNAFSMTNAQLGSTGDKTLWINLSGENPLIVKMDLGFTITLKEIK